MRLVTDILGVASIIIAIMSMIADAFSMTNTWLYVLGVCLVYLLCYFSYHLGARDLF